MNPHSFKATAWSGAGYVIGSLLVYAYLLRAAFSSNSLLFMSMGSLFLLVLPYMAVSWIAGLFNTSVELIWMFAPLILTALVPEP